jgi:hypothetical protein
MTELDGSNQKSRLISLFTLLLCALACFYYYHFFFNRSHVVLDIQVDQQTDFKLYWAAEKKLFSEKRMAEILVSPEQTSYSFFLSDLGSIERLRIDPLEHEGSALVKQIIISQKGYNTLNLDFQKLEPLYDITDFSVDSQGVEIESAGNDPNFLYIPVIKKAPVNWLSEIINYGLICLLIIVVTRSCASLHKDYRYVPVMLGVIFVLIVSMAAISKRNAHPDEYVHLNATRYYQENWLPPPIDDQDIENTYSVYGVSRLNNGEIYYLLAGKFSRAVAVFQISDLFAFRLFNISLFACILLYAAASIPARLVALPFILSPQVWYIFSYCGSDAFGLFLCFIAGCELVRPHSFLNRLLDPQKKRGLLLALTVLPVTLGLLFLLKINYYPFIGLFFLCVIWQLFKSVAAEDRRRVLTRISLVVLLALTLAGLRIGADYYVNGFDRQEKVAAMQEKKAHHWYKPSTELHKKHISLYLKARGTTLKELVQGHQWFKHSFVTGFGTYGYFTIAAPKIYYELVKWTALAFLIYLFLIIAMQGSMENRLLALLSICLAIALMGASLYRSWTIDFQAQGRYLFPILPMLGILLARSRYLFETRVFTLLVSQLFVLGVYSFIFIALVSIARPG